MNSAVVEVAVSTSATTAVATAINAEPLLTALIGLGISIVTVVGGELVKFLVAWLRQKRHVIEVKDPKPELNNQDKEGGNQQ